MASTSRNGKSRNENKSLLKVLILGDGAVGKSCLMTRFINNQFEENSFHTIGVEFLNKEYTVNNKTYTLQIWDTAGQERFKSLRTPFYRGTDICLIVFAFDDKSSFQNMSLWRQEFLHYADIENPHSFPLIIVGNKVDLSQSSRQVSTEEALQWVAYHDGLPYYETSAKDDVNVGLVFHEAVQLWLKREADLDDRMRSLSSTLYLNQQKDQTQVQKKKCC